MLKKILLIDDDEVVNRIYIQAFALAGYTVSVATTGKEGLKKLQSEKFDLVLLDVMLPELNGIEVLQKIKEIPALHSLPVVMLTNLSGNQEIDKLKSLGIHAYFIKSNYKPKEIVEKVNKILYA